MSSTTAFDIGVNGKPHPVTPGTTLTDLVIALGRKPELVAIERNGEIVPRSRYADTTLAPEDRLEIVHFVQGGSTHSPQSRLAFSRTQPIRFAALGAASSIGRATDS